MAESLYGGYQVGKPIFKDYFLKGGIGRGTASYVFQVANPARTRALKVLFQETDWDSKTEKGENRGVKSVKDIPSPHLVDIVNFPQARVTCGKTATCTDAIWTANTAFVRFSRDNDG